MRQRLLTQCPKSPALLPSAVLAVLALLAPLAILTDVLAHLSSLALPAPRRASHAQPPRTPERPTAVEPPRRQSHLFAGCPHSRTSRGGEPSSSGGPSSPPQPLALRGRCSPRLAARFCACAGRVLCCVGTLNGVPAQGGGEPAHGEGAEGREGLFSMNFGHDVAGATQHTAEARKRKTPLRRARQALF